MFTLYPSILHIKKNREGNPKHEQKKSNIKLQGKKKEKREIRTQTGEKTTLEKEKKRKMMIQAKLEPATCEHRPWGGSNIFTLGRYPVHM